jgi:hypothetical protein
MHFLFTFTSIHTQEGLPNETQQPSLHAHAGGEQHERYFATLTYLERVESCSTGQQSDSAARRNDYQHYTVYTYSRSAYRQSEQRADTNIGGCNRANAVGADHGSHHAKPMGEPVRR